MTRARLPRPQEVAAAERDPRFLRAIRDRQDDGAWRTRGVCQSVDPETFFPAPSEPADAALALCRTCQVQGACLAWALDVGDCHGVWGATTPRERRAMLVAWRTDDEERPDGIVEIPALLPVAARAPVTASSSPPAAGRRLGLVPEQRAPRQLAQSPVAQSQVAQSPAARSRGDRDLVQRVAS
jgi:hypothetical protein